MKLRILLIVALLPLLLLTACLLATASFPEGETGPEGIFAGHPKRFGTL